MSNNVFGDIVAENLKEMEQWIGSLAVVTGAGFGIGAILSRKLVNAGLIVIGLGKNLEALEEVENSLDSENGSFHAKQCDITVESEILETFQWIEESFGPISILINNASILKPTSIKDGDIEMWKKTFDVNVLAVCICTKEALKSMRKNGIDGHIVHIGSVTGHYVPDVDNPEPIFNVYSASKHALVAITETHRKELLRADSKIKVSTVSHGITLADLYNEFPEETVRHLLDMPQLQPDDVANAVMYVLGTPPGVQVQDVVIRAIGEKI